MSVKSASPVFGSTLLEGRVVIDDAPWHPGNWATILAVVESAVLAQVALRARLAAITEAVVSLARPSTGLTCAKTEFRYPEAVATQAFGKSIATLKELAAQDPLVRGRNDLVGGPAPRRLMLVARIADRKATSWRSRYGAIRAERAVARSCRGSGAPQSGLKLRIPRKIDRNGQDFAASLCKFRNNLDW